MSMKLLAEISDHSLGLDTAREIIGEKYTLRKAARVVLINEANEISLQHVSKFGYYKLPGGGINPGESVEEGLRREIHEEVGCDIQIEEELGITIEYRAKHEIIHISYGYIGRVLGRIGEPHFEEAEQAAGMEAVWIPFDKAIGLVEQHRRVEAHYQAPFIVERELAFLREAVRLLQTSAA